MTHTVTTDAAIDLLRTHRFVALPNSPSRMPITYQEFVSGPAAQQRYWARSHIGWGRMKRARPNPGHLALARLEVLGSLQLLVTQNVDGLHEQAGSHNLCALHGRIADVVCRFCSWPDLR